MTAEKSFWQEQGMIYGPDALLTSRLSLLAAEARLAGEKDPAGSEAMSGVIANAQALGDDLRKQGKLTAEIAQTLIILSEDVHQAVFQDSGIDLAGADRAQYLSVVVDGAKNRFENIRNDCLGI